MNLIDGYVEEVLEHKKFTVADKVYDIFIVKYNDIGQGGITELWFEEDKNITVEVGYHFLH